MYWQSKMDSQNIKHGFYKRNNKSSPEEVITDCFLSRVLNTNDLLDGMPKVERTPKNKIVSYRASSQDASGQKYYYTVSRVFGLEGQQPTGTVSGNDLFSYLRKDDKNKQALSGTFSALVDAVLVGRWDLKTQNLSAPNVRNFDMTMALGEERDTYAKVWNKKDFESLVTGTTSGKNKIPKKYKAGSVEAIAYGFTQTIADFGSRVNEYYSGSNSIYSGVDKKTQQKHFSKIYKSIKQDIIDNLKNEESPSLAVLRIFKERSQEIRESLGRRNKNPKLEVFNELQRVGAPKEHMSKLYNVERKLRDSLSNIERFVDELSHGKLKGVSPTSVTMRKRVREENFETFDSKVARIHLISEEDSVEVFGRKIYSVDKHKIDQHKSFLKYLEDSSYYQLDR